MVSFFLLWLDRYSTVPIFIPKTILKAYKSNKFGGAIKWLICNTIGFLPTNIEVPIKTRGDCHYRTALLHSLLMVFVIVKCYVCIRGGSKHDVEHPPATDWFTFYTNSTTFVLSNDLWWKVNPSSYEMSLLFRAFGNNNRQQYGFKFLRVTEICKIEMEMYIVDKIISVNYYCLIIRIFYIPTTQKWIGRYEFIYWNSNFLLLCTKKNSFFDL